MNRVMQTMSTQQPSVTRLQRQTRRLRNLLARAWRDRRSPQLIARVERMLQARWRMLDRAYQNHPLP